MANFSGRTPAADNIDEFTVSLAIQPAPEVRVGFCFLSDLAETEIEFARLTGVLTTDHDSGVEGIGAFLDLDFGQVTLNAEYIGALDSFNQRQSSIALN